MPRRGAVGAAEVAPEAPEAPVAEVNAEVGQLHALVKALQARLDAQEAKAEQVAKSVEAATKQDLQTLREASMTARQKRNERLQADIEAGKAVQLVCTCNGVVPGYQLTPVRRGQTFWAAPGEARLYRARGQAVTPEDYELRQQDLTGVTADKLEAFED